MMDDEVLEEAHVEGFELIERISAGVWAVGWGPAAMTTGGRVTSRNAKR